MMTYRPVLFVPHGSPMFALNPGAAGAAMSRLAGQLGAFAAIVVISPHWETGVPTVGTAAALPTIHDFGGFDPRLYEIEYPAHGSQAAAQAVITALQTAGFPVASDPSRGLDHGAWVPLRQMFPSAGVPIVALSIQHHLGPAHAYAVGKALAPLTEQGFLIVASGNITHNLADFRIAQAMGPSEAPYAHEFSDWVYAKMTARQDQALIDYRKTQPLGVRAHPRDEHLLPLFTALGAAGPDAQPKAFFRGISDAVIAMDGYAFS